MEIARLAVQNPWWAARSAISDDPKLLELASAPLQWRPRLAEHMPLDADVVYTIRGPRQVGKTCLQKLLVRSLLSQADVPATSVLYYACDHVRSPEALLDLMASFLEWSARLDAGRKYLFLDEVTSVQGWQTAVKRLVDQRSNRGMTLVLTGSHAVEMKRSAERLPGRTGESTGLQTQKVLLPMKFAEYVETVHPELGDAPRRLGLRGDARRRELTRLAGGRAPESLPALLPLLPELARALDGYLLTGGFMLAANQLTERGRVPATVYELYIRSLVGDLARLDRSERTARQLAGALVQRMGSALAWNALSKDADVPSPITAQQYVEILEGMLVVQAVLALDEGAGRARPVAQKKLYVRDPFIFHALRGWSEGAEGDYFRASVDFLASTANASALLEAVLADHLARAAYGLGPSDVFDPTESVPYSRTKKGREVDFVLRLGDGLHPFELKWQAEVRRSDLANLRRFRHGVLVSRDSFAEEPGFLTIPLPLLLMYV